MRLELSLWSLRIVGAAGCGRRRRWLGTRILSLRWRAERRLITGRLAIGRLAIGRLITDLLICWLLISGGRLTLLALFQLPHGSPQRIEQSRHLACGYKDPRADGRLRKKAGEEIEPELAGAMTDHHTIGIHATEHFVRQLQVVIDLLRRWPPGLVGVLGGRSWRLTETRLVQIQVQSMRSPD